MSYEPPTDPPTYGPEPSAAGARLNGPAVGLIVVGILNLIIGVLIILGGMATQSIPAEQVQKELEKKPEQRKQLEEAKKAGWDMQDIMKIYLYGGVGMGAVVLAASILIIAAGACMLTRKAHVLAILGAVTAAIPCISPTSCLLVGMGIGIWALVVLLNPEVKAAFTTRPGDLPPGPAWGDDNLP